MTIACAARSGTLRSMSIEAESKSMGVMGGVIAVVFLTMFVGSASRMGAPAIFTVVPVLLIALVLIRIVLRLVAGSPAQELAHARAVLEDGPLAGVKKPAASGAGVVCRYCGRSRSMRARSRS